jgi:large subunit ribosomal protein L5
MKFSNKLLNKHLRLSEDYTYNYPLDYITKFNEDTYLQSKECVKITLNFGFKKIKFEKKKMILFFFILELITGQKCVLTSSRKNLIFLKIKKGSVTGCKVVLRNVNLFEFLDTLLLALPRSETFKGFFFNLKSRKKNHYSTQINDFFIFYSLESEIASYIKHLDMSFSFNTISDSEKLFLLSYLKMPLSFKSR